MPDEQVPETLALVRLLRHAARALDQQASHEHRRAQAIRARGSGRLAVAFHEGNARHLGTLAEDARRLVGLALQQHHTWARKQRRRAARAAE